MTVDLSESIAPKGENVGNHSGVWNDIDWDRAEAMVSRMQCRISKAWSKGDYNLAKRLQYLLSNSFYAKALAVRKVTSNKGRTTPGVDGQLWLTDSLKMAAVHTLNRRGYRAKPLRRVYIPKKSGKLRPLSIPTMYDRAMQTLFNMCLDPIQEATADPNSYGFRLGRSCQDARERLHVVLSRKDSVQWVLEGDIKGCFDHISHEWMERNIPLDKKVLHQFLKAGYVFQERLFPNEEGTPQGGAISPTLANMVLNGLEGRISEHFGKNAKVRLTRFADDFVVTCPSRECAEEVRAVIVPFLSERGLELSEEKTLITNIHDGFDFLGWNFRKYPDGKLLIKPSKASVGNIMDRLKEVISVHGKALSQTRLIGYLNPILRGWCNYHRCSVAKATFSWIGEYLFRLLWRWALRRHRNKGLRWVKDRYWPSVNGIKWVFTDGDKACLFNPCNVPIKRHVKVRNDMNPYVDRTYFEDRRRTGRGLKSERGFRNKEIAP